MFVILCFTGLNDNELDIDGIPFTTLGYANGPGAHEELKSINKTGFRRNVTEEQSSKTKNITLRIFRVSDSNKPFLNLSLSFHLALLM